MTSTRQEKAQTEVQEIIQNMKSSGAKGFIEYIEKSFFAFIQSEDYRSQGDRVVCDDVFHYQELLRLAKAVNAQWEEEMAA